VTENARPEIVRLDTRDQITRVDIARPDNAAPDQRWTVHDAL